MNVNIRVVEWAAAECERQHSGEMSVARMAVGWSFAWDNFKDWYKSDSYTDVSNAPTVGLIQILATIVEPEKNRSGFRQTNVLVSDKLAETTPWREVPRLMDALIDAWNNLSADEWYKAFQGIHPFADGNGRVGAILWNAHRGTLRPDKLEVPPDFWK
jgi:Fic/DOC family